MGGPPTGAGALVGQRLGKYELLALLALGGTAEIYLARIDGTAGFEKYVVVKCLHDHLAEDQEFVSMFLDEARLGAQLDHSNIVQTLALGEHEGRYYLVMEFIAGLSLALVGRRASERVRGGKVPVPITLNVVAQACGGLHYAHDKVEALVHRDISPQNLVITYEGIVKIVDFGIAKAEYRETRTRSGTVKGKFAYMSPEQCQAGQVDRRTDVFALGVIAWELLTGRRLFKRDSTYETYQAVVACNVPAPSQVNHELDPAIDGLVMKALAKEKERRYPTAEAFGEAMMGYLHHRGKPSGPGEIARFFDECFRQELADHEMRMREMMEGRKKSVAEQKLLQWDASELDGSASVLEPEELSAVLEESESAPRVTADQMVSSGRVGPSSPPMARHPALEPAAPIDRPRQETLPVRKLEPQPPPQRPGTDTTPDGPIAPEDDFEGGFTTDVENRFSPEGDATKIDEPRRATTTDERRKPKKVLTPPGLRAGGAPLDPLPHEREQMLAHATPPPTAVPLPAPPAPGRFIEAPTVLAPDDKLPLRFADVKTVHAVGTPAGMPQNQLGPEPQTGTGQTQMLEPGDLLEVSESQPQPVNYSYASVLPTLAQQLPVPAQVVAMPRPTAAFPDNAYHQHLARGGAPRKLPPWALGVMFVVVLALATGITVALARALS